MQNWANEKDSHGVGGNTMEATHLLLARATGEPTIELPLLPILTPLHWNGIFTPPTQGSVLSPPSKLSLVAGWIAHTPQARIYQVSFVVRVRERGGGGS